MLVINELNKKGTNIEISVRLFGVWRTKVYNLSI